MFGWLVVRCNKFPSSQQSRDRRQSGLKVIRHPVVVQLDPGFVWEFTVQFDLVCEMRSVLGCGYGYLHPRLAVIAGAAGWSLETLTKASRIFAELVRVFLPAFGK